MTWITGVFLYNKDMISTIRDNKALYGVGLAIISAIIIYMFFSYFLKSKDASDHVSIDPAHREVAYFAGGCFWCVESDFEKLSGVDDVISGYSGGNLENPTYPNHGDHREAVMVPFDSSTISYRELVNYFFRHHDATDAGGSFYDRGHSYTSAIYYTDNGQKQIAESVVAELDTTGILGGPIVTSFD